MKQAMQISTIKFMNYKYLFGAVILLVGGGFLYYSVSEVDFSDRPALLINISPSFEATIEVNGQYVTRHLYGLPKSSALSLSSSARSIIDMAKQDKVAFEEKRDGTLKIWFESENGHQSLNEMLIKNSINGPP